jgi:hypothetical protein
VQTGVSPAIGSGIIAKNEYDLETDKTKVLSITEFFTENIDANDKIRSLILPRMHNGIGIFDIAEAVHEKVGGCELEIAIWQVQIQSEYHTIT